ETVGSMGDRTGAVAGVNGDYFDINASGQPDGGAIRDGDLIKSPTPNFSAQLAVRADGSMVIGPEPYTGTVTDGTATFKVSSVNTVGDAAAGRLTHNPADLGADSGLPAETLALGHTTPAGLVVDSVQTGVKSVPALDSDQQGLLGGGAAGTWLAGNVHVGDTLAI